MYSTRQYFIYSTIKTRYPKIIDSMFLNLFRLKLFSGGDSIMRLDSCPPFEPIIDLDTQWATINEIKILDIEYCHNQI